MKLRLRFKLYRFGEASNFPGPNVFMRESFRPTFGLNLEDNSKYKRPKKSSQPWGRGKLEISQADINYNYGKWYDSTTIFENTFAKCFGIENSISTFVVNAGKLTVETVHFSNFDMDIL